MVYFVRTAGERDLDKVRALLVETFHATYDVIYGEAKVRELVDAWHSPEALKARVEKTGGEFLVADDGKQLGGVAYAVMSKKMAKTAFLHHLYVKPSCQGQGIGRDIFAELETCFPDAEVMRLEVAVQNTRAISFYERLGFLEVDRTQECGGPASGLAAVVLEKPLPR
ncbi:MAG: GNAT family N-acetyltransferase [Pseudorhizobium sp.]